MDDRITGSFDEAIQQLIRDLVDGKKSSYEMLSRWDKARGTDWFVETKKGLQYKKDLEG